MTWNPLQRRDAVTFPLAVSGGTATATFRPWGAGERIAYEDALTSRLMELGVDEDGGHGEALKLGTMRLVQLALTIESVSGFPEECEVELGDGTRAVVPFDPRDERCLRQLDGDTYEELRELASKVQRPPGEEEPEETPADAAEGAGEPSGPDPSPTPSTPPDSTSKARPRARASSAAG